jgi:hypothetical protein
VSQTPADPLTGVSAVDPVILAAEADAAWAVMKHHERRCEKLAQELEYETRMRRLCQIKADGFDRLAAELKTLTVQIQNTAKVFGTLNDIIRSTQKQAGKLTEAQRQEAQR